MPHTHSKSFAKQARTHLLPSLVLAATGLMGAQSALAVNVKVEQFVEAKDPWGMAAMKDGTFFFTEKCGGLSVRTPSGSVNKLLGIGGSAGYSSVKNDLFCDGQAGVLGVAVDPEFDKNRFVYLRSTSKGDNRAFGGYANILMRMKVSADMKSVSDVTEIINDMGYKPKKSNHPFGGPGAHNGGALAFGPDGFLYVTIGDNHSGPGPQDGTKLVGKVLRVDRDGKGAAGNKPPAGFDQRIFTYGHRNPQGITFRGNDVYISENGPWHSDEVTKLVNGGNGGWDPRGEVNGRPACPDGYCGYSPNQMGAMPQKERAAFMPMTDLKAYPNAMKPAFNNGGLSQGMCGSAWLVGKQWKEWEGRLAVGYAGIGIHGTPVGNRIDILDVSKDGMSAKKIEMSYPDYAGRVRHLHSAEGVLYVGDETRGAIFKVTPQ